MRKKYTMRIIPELERLFSSIDWTFNSELCAFIILDSKFQEEAVWPEEACASRFINGEWAEEEVEGRFVWCLIPPHAHPDLPEEKELRAYYWYLMNKSPVKEVFVRMPLDFACDYGLIVDLTKPHDKVGWGIKSTRLPWEEPIVIQRWMDYRRKGLRSDAALVLSHCKRPDRALYTGVSHCAIPQDPLLIFDAYVTKETRNSPSFLENEGYWSENLFRKSNTFRKLLEDFTITTGKAENRIVWGNPATIHSLSTEGLIKFTKRYMKEVLGV